MNINADFGERIVVNTSQMPWTPSPQLGVERRMLDRIGGEVARATSVVRYAAGSSFPRHVHTGGEEFLVLNGVFQDEHGEYPAGTYVRNPPGSSHAPASAIGCTLFVKLWQFDLADTEHVRLDSGQVRALSPQVRPGITEFPLFKNAREYVCIEDWQPGCTVTCDVPAGAEYFVLKGSFEDAGQKLVEGCWLRLPCGSRLNAVASPNGTKLWVKTGHLSHIAHP